MAKEKQKSQSEKVLDRIDRLKSRAEEAKTQRDKPITETEFLEKLKEK